MEPNKDEVDAFWEVMLTPPEEFVTERERADRGDDWCEKMAHQRMAKQAIKAVDKARGDRTQWMVVLRHGRGESTVYTGYGPYSTKAQGERAQEKLAHTFHSTGYALVPMRNAEGLADLLEQVDTRPDLAGDWAVVSEDARLFKKAGWNGKNATRAAALERLVG